MPHRARAVTIVVMSLLPVPERRDPTQMVADPERVAALLADLEAQRAVAAAHAAAHAATNDALLTHSGVVDLESARQCRCSCHPRIAALHDGGRTCPCQSSRAERAAALHAALDALRELEDDPTHVAARVAAANAFLERAGTLGVEVVEHGGAAPYCITGTVDGRSFLYRERHDHWRVEIAPDADPAAAFWVNPDAVSIVIARGEAVADDSAGLEALETAVAAVRSYLLRRACAHPGAAAYCPVCGLDAASFSSWQTGGWNA